MDSEVPGTVGVCPTSDVFRDYANKGTRLLMNRGNFWGTVERIKFCVYNGCVVYPRFVGTVLAENICGRNSEMWNNWYQFMPLSRADFCGGGFQWHGVEGAMCSGNLKTINDGVSPVFNPIACGRPNYVRAYPSVQQDVGKKTRIFGINEGGQVVRTQNADLTWADGVELTMAIPFVSTSMKFREITRITKVETQNIVRYYQYDADNDVLLDLVFLEPTELSPMYRKSKLPTRCRGGSCNGLTSVEALVKLEFIPVKYPTDLVQISNRDALSDMMLSVKYSNAGDAAMAKDFEAKSIREMNLELNNRYPNDQTAVEINPFGSALPERHCVGSII